MLRNTYFPLWSRHPLRGGHASTRKPMSRPRVVEIQSVGEEQVWPKLSQHSREIEQPIEPNQPKPIVDQPAQPAAAFEKLRVSEVFCPVCRSVQPVYEVLGQESSDLTVYHVVCRTCSSVVGQRTITEIKEPA